MDNRLIEMLRGAKKVMEKVNENEGVVNQPNLNSSVTSYDREKPMPLMGGVDGTQLLESLPQGAVPNEYAPRTVNNLEPIQQTYKNINTTKMPKEIVESLIKNPIEQPNITLNAAGQRTFSLDDLPDDLKRPSAQVKAPAQQTIPITESTLKNSKGETMIIISETDLNKRIRQEVLRVLKNDYTKTITNEAIKKTITTLIKEGKIRVRNKKQQL